MLFAIGAAMAWPDHDGTAGLAGLVSFLMMQQLLNPGVVGMVRHLEEGTATYIAFQKVAGNSFIGILAAVVGAACYNKFKDIQLPDWLAFFSGKRFVAIATGLISILVSVVLLFVWPVIFDALVAIGNGIAGMSGIGAGIYAFLNRLLIPTGLHHALNNVFWFDTIGLGDLNHFWAGDVTGQNGVTWSLGMYMSGFFPCMMFGIAGAALAMVRTAKNKKAAIGLVLSAACGPRLRRHRSLRVRICSVLPCTRVLCPVRHLHHHHLLLRFPCWLLLSAGALLTWCPPLPRLQLLRLDDHSGHRSIRGTLLRVLLRHHQVRPEDPGREDDDEEAEKKVTLANNNWHRKSPAVLAAVGGKEKHPADVTVQPGSASRSWTTLR